MPLIDPTTSIGKMRLRVGDWRDIPIMPDSVYTSALADCDDNLPRASALVAQYILATLAHKTHRKMQGLETWGNEQFDNYLKYLKLTVMNPNLMQLAPIPYDNSAEHPLIEFVEAWNCEFAANRHLTL